MKVRTKWIWSLWEGILIVVPLVLVFINWKWGLLAAAIDLILFGIWCFLILNVGLNTRCPFGVSKIIHLADTHALKPDDKKRIAWIEEKGKPMEMITPDGMQLEGRLLEHPDPKGIVYIAHGYGDYQYASVHKPAEQFYALGYTVFLSHSRGFSARAGKWSSMGVRERADHIHWLQTLHKQFPEQVFFLYGVSMGAASVMNLCDLEEDLPLRGIVEDCGYVDLYEQMEHSLHSVLQLPHWPVLPATNLLCRWICGFSLHDLNVKTKLKNSRWPILAFHGREDDFVPFRNLDEVVKAGGKRVIEAYYIEGAAHCQSFNKAPAFYWQSVERFLNRCRQYSSWTPADFEVLYHFEEKEDGQKEEPIRSIVPGSVHEEKRQTEKTSARIRTDPASANADHSERDKK